MSSISPVDELAQAIVRIIDERKPQNVKQLIAFVKEQLPLSEEKILDAVLKLQSQGKIKLGNQPPTSLAQTGNIHQNGTGPLVLGDHSNSHNNRSHRFHSPRRLLPMELPKNALGVIFVLWLPGYTFIKALFPIHLPTKTSTENLDTIERIALSLGMSLALVPIIGLLLNYTPWGIRLTPIVLSLLALTIVFATAAIIRENQAKTSETSTRHLKQSSL